MAQLKDTLVTGDLRVTDNTTTESLQVTTINAKTGSSATTYGPGTDGQVLKSNGTSTYWASDSNTDTKVTQTATTTAADYRVLFSETADNTTRTEGARKNSALTFNPSTGTLRTTNLNLSKTQNQMLTGTGTAARDAGETADPRYFPAKWTYDADITPSDGDIIVIKIPVAGHTYGVFISVNNGTTYYPISVNGTTRLTTNYGNGQIISLVFASNGQTNDMFPLDGGNSRVNISGGCWRVTNYYDSNTTYSAMSSSELTTGTTTTLRVVRSDYLKTGINSLIDTKIQALDVTGDSSIAASKTIKSWSETDGKVSVTTQDIAISKTQVTDFPTLGTAAAKDVPASGNASTTQVVMGDDTRLTNSRTPTSHTHGNIQNGGTLQTNDITIASGDKLVVTDSSDSSKIARTSVSFDGSTATKCLTQKGTWESFSNNAGTVTSVKVGTQSYSPSSGVVSLPAYPTTLPASDTTSTYSATGTAPVNGTAVAAAMGTLDGTVSGSAGASKTLTAFSQTDGKVSATFGNISITKSQVSDFPTLGTAAAKDVPSSGNASTTQVVMGDDTRLSDSRTPKSHTHGNIANGGTISSTAVTPANTDYILMSDTSNSGKIERGIAIGTDTTKYLRNDGTWQVPPDTKNTTGSTDTSSKIYLVGATSQAANPQTYSDNEVYATNGVLTTKSVQVGGTAATIQYNSTTKCIDFVFSS